MLHTTKGGGFHDFECDSLLRALPFLLKKKNPSQPLKITEPFVSVHSLQPQTPAVCVCVLSVREAALPVFLVWCGASPPQQLLLPSF